MTDFDYGNARLRAMKSRLLSRKELEGLAEAGSLQGLIAALTRTTYHRPVEAALARATGMESLAEALRAELLNTVGKVPTFYGGESGEQVAIVLRQYDIHNLKAVLRGLSKDAAPAEILNSTLPVGQLSARLLGELAGIHGARAAIDLLASQGSPFAQPLLKLRGERPGAEIFEMELALEQWHDREARKALEELGESRWLLAALDFDADLTNLQTVLRFANAPAERNLLRERFGGEDLTRLFVGPGKLPLALLAAAGEQDSVAAAVDLFAETRYAAPLQEGLQAYARSARLSDLEMRLQRARLDWAASLVAKDPLGIGVVLGYVALKINEVSNIRWIARAIALSLKPEAIKAEVEFVS